MLLRFRVRAVVPFLVAAAMVLVAGCAADASSSPPPPSPTTVPDDAWWEATPDATVEVPPPNPSRLPASTALDPAGFIPADSPFGSWPEFVSPSGNLTCAIPGVSGGQGFRAMCSAAEHSWAYDPCEPESPICARFTMIDPSGVVTSGMNGGAVAAFEVGIPVNVLPYGNSISYGGVTCASTEEGMICEDESTRQGFLMSRSRHEWF